MNFLVYLEGTLYPSMSPLEKRRDIFLFLPQSKDLTYRDNVPPTLRE
jgi:hypothetical protein